MNRRKSAVIQVGSLAIGGQNPIVVQSMCNTKTADIAATVRQIEALAAAGCQLVRLAVLDMEDALALKTLVARVSLPLVADSHFDYNLALQAIESGVHKVRINPGNIGDAQKVKEVAQAARAAKTPIRIGINGGSLDKTLVEKFGGVTPEALVASAMGHIALLNQFDFNDIAVSIKASSVATTIAANRLFAQQTDYPIHLGVTEAGTVAMGTVKSSIGIGALLADGIGDTLRVSLTADSVEEIPVAYAILRSLGLHEQGVEVISCPSCGRCRIALIDIANRVEQATCHLQKKCTVAVMGCAVNGPGEAREADIGIAGGVGEVLLFKKGEIIGKIPEHEAVERLVREIELL